MVLRMNLWTVSSPKRKNPLNLKKQNQFTGQCFPYNRISCGEAMEKADLQYLSIVGLLAIIIWGGYINNTLAKGDNV